MGGTDVADWKFIEYSDVPFGPWSRFGENNSFVVDARRKAMRLAQTKKPASPAAGDAPAVVTKQ